MQTGQSLSHYRLIEKIGEGGMGVVWSAEDTVLQRSVALKILPEEFARDPERLARFEREARFLASLNHANIAAIHGLEQAEGRRFLVLELVPGESLAVRLVKRRPTVKETLTCCCAVARALVVGCESRPGEVGAASLGSVVIDLVRSVIRPGSSTPCHPRDW